MSAALVAWRSSTCRARDGSVTCVLERTMTTHSRAVRIRSLQTVARSSIATTSTLRTHAGARLWTLSAQHRSGGLAIFCPGSSRGTTSGPPAGRPGSTRPPRAGYLAASCLRSAAQRRALGAAGWHGLAGHLVRMTRKESNLRPPPDRSEILETDREGPQVWSGRPTVSDRSTPTSG